MRGHWKRWFDGREFPGWIGQERKIQNFCGKGYKGHKHGILTFVSGLRA